MSLQTCLQFGFTCKETIDAKEKEVNDKLTTLKINKASLEKEISDLQIRSTEVQNHLYENEHYAFLYNDLPPLHVCGVKRTEDDKWKLAKQFDMSVTYYPTTDPKKLYVSTTGLSNYKIPRDIMQKLLDKYPIKLYARSDATATNHVIRFISYINIGVYWCSCIFAVKTKTKWVVGFWDTITDSILYADPITKQIWVPMKGATDDTPIYMMD